MQLLLEGIARPGPTVIQTSAVESFAPRRIVVQGDGGSLNGLGLSSVTIDRKEQLDVSFSPVPLAVFTAEVRGVKISFDRIEAGKTVSVTVVNEGKRARQVKIELTDILPP